jgi:hypothetical protein
MLSDLIRGIFKSDPSGCDGLRLHHTEAGGRRKLAAILPAKSAGCLPADRPAQFAEPLQQKTCKTEPGLPMLESGIKADRPAMLAVRPLNKLA